MTDISITAIPGEAAIVAIANLITSLAEGQSAEQKVALWQRYEDLTAPWHAIAVSISTDAAGFVKNILKLNPTTPAK